MTDASFEREKWRDELALKRSELDLRGRELAVSEGDLEVKREESRKSRWRHPLVVAIFAAAVAALTNAAVGLTNGLMSSSLEEKKAEGALILEAIKTSNSKTAAQNLGFLVEVGLVRDIDRRRKIDEYLKTHPNAPPVLPTGGRGSTSTIRNIPADQVEVTAELARIGGATSVVSTKQPDGSYTVTFQTP